MDNLMWHFAAVGEDGVPRLGHGDGREVRVGETLAIEGEPALCEHGLHASARVLDALQYACSDRLALCRVTLSGTVIHDDDKSVATERTVITMLDAAKTDALLRAFARWSALSVAHLWDMPDVVRRYLETGDETIRAAAEAAARAAAGAAAEAAARAAAGAAARAAARAAAGDAAWAAARDAARAAAWAAARAAAGDAAGDAAWAAAWAVAWDAARAAARAAAGDAAWAAAGDAAWAAAWAAAWDAAGDAQEDHLRRLFDAALERQEVDGE